MKHIRRIGLLVLLPAIVLLPGTAYAHVVVTPNQAGIAEELVFNVSVPNEKHVPVTSVKLLIPGGVTDVTPTAMDGWKITTAMDNASPDAEVSAITWSGSIPVGQRQDFSFGAQAPAQATKLDWKAYQTYADGSVVHWDQVPTGSDDATGDAGPYSVTNVINDLAGTAASSPNIDWNVVGPYIIAGLALAVACLALLRRA